MTSAADEPCWPASPLADVEGIDRLEVHEMVLMSKGWMTSQATDARLRMLSTGRLETVSTCCSIAASVCLARRW